MDPSGWSLVVEREFPRLDFFTGVFSFSLGSYSSPLESAVIHAGKFDTVRLEVSLDVSLEVSVGGIEGSDGDCAGGGREDIQEGMFTPRPRPRPGLDIGGREGEWTRGRYEIGELQKYLTLNVGLLVMYYLACNVNSSPRTSMRVVSMRNGDRSSNWFGHNRAG